MLSDGKAFDTNMFFSGGAGMFIQYHDVVKPVYLFAIAKMILTETSYGLPLNIIKDMSILSLIEWYHQRRYINPLRCLDPLRQIDPKDLDNLMNDILRDDSIYRLAPSMNINPMMEVYRKNHMRFPIYIYSENEEPFIEKDSKEVFSGIQIKYLHGDLKTAVSRCDQNFTYILSDIELVKELCGILIGTCSHIILAKEYRYNYKDGCKTFKYDLRDLMRNHPFLRLGTSIVGDPYNLALSFKNLISQEERINRNNVTTQ